MNIIAAVNRFDDWSHPWLFRQSVAESLDAADADLFDRIWREAVDARHWREGDLSVGASHASVALGAQFPLLPREAVEAVVRAASYQWR